MDKEPDSFRRERVCYRKAGLPGANHEHIHLASIDRHDAFDYVTAAPFMLRAGTRLGWNGGLFP